MKGSTLCSGLIALGLLLSSEVYAAEPTTEPDYATRQQGLQQTNPVAAWQRGQGKDVVVAVLDTGVQSSHPDLNDNLLLGYDYVDNQSDGSTDPNGHGTHIAGIIAALVNGVGITGIAPQAEILPVRVLNDAKGSEAMAYCEDYNDPETAPNPNCSKRTMLSTIKGIQSAALYALTKNKRMVINASFGSPAENGYCAAIDKLFSDHPELENLVIIVAAAMNENTSAERYPAACSRVFAVAAVDENDVRWTEGPRASNFGSWVSIAAPGKQVYSTWLEGAYRPQSGTSMATPFVAGAVAVLLSADPSLSPKQAMQYLLDNTDPLNDSGLGAGRLNLSKAMSAIPAPPVAPTAPVAPSNFSIQ